MIAWWPGDGNANDIFGTNNSVLLGGATASAVGKAGQAFDLNGTSAYVEVTDSPTLDLPGGMTIEMWVMPYVPLSEQLPWASLASKYDGVSVWRGWFVGTTGSQDYWPPGGHGNLGADFRDGTGAIRSMWPDAPDLMPPYQFSHFAVTYDQGAGVTTLYVNGQLVAQDVVGSLRIPNVPYPLRIGADNQVPISGFFWGRIDEVSLYSRALGSSEIAAIYAAGAVGKCKNPLITKHPQTQIGYWGKSVSFSVAAKGTAPMRYQWVKDGAPVAGATNAVLELTNLQATNSGAYSVIVSNSVASVTTYPGQLSVSPVEMYFGLYPGMLIKGVVGQTYGIQSSIAISDTNSWIGITNITLTTPTFQWYDSQPATQPQHYYRVVPGPIPVP